MVYISTEILSLWCICATAATTEVCDGERLNASCTSGTVLMIENAVYGRMRAGGKCEISAALIGCSTDATPYVERQCAGRRRCQMEVSRDIRQWASANEGCPSDQIGYLRVSYYCLPGKPPSVLYTYFTYSAAVTCSF